MYLVFSGGISTGLVILFRLSPLCVLQFPSLDLSQEDVIIGDRPSAAVHVTGALWGTQMGSVCALLFHKCIIYLRWGTAFSYERIH